MIKNAINAKNLIESLIIGNFIDSSNSKKIKNYIDSDRQEKDFSFSQNIFLSIGVFILSICSYTYITTIMFKLNWLFMFFGIFYISLALLLSKISRDASKNLRNKSLIQTSVLIMCLGKILFVFGCSVKFAELVGVESTLFLTFAPWVPTLVLLGTTVITYNTYGLNIDRFYSSLFVLNMMLIAAITTRSPWIKNIYICLLLVVEIALSAILILPRIAKSYHPLGYASLFSLCITVFYISIFSSILSSEAVPRTIILNFSVLILTSILIGLIVWVAGNKEYIKTQPGVIALVFATLIGAISTPGITLSLCFLIIGFKQSNKIVYYLGIILMPIVLSFYYYNLNTTLMIKSGILIASGLILLAGRTYIISKKIDQE